MRILLTGSLNTGKSKIAEELVQAIALPYYHTDSLLSDGNMDWTETNAKVLSWMQTPGPWLICGVRVPYALRQWEKEALPGTPADVAIYLKGARLAHTTKAQEAMSKGLYGVWRSVEHLIPRTLYREYDDRLTQELLDTFKYLDHGASG